MLYFGDFIDKVFEITYTLSMKVLGKEGWLIMKGYTSPKMEQIDNFLEGVYAAGSGYVPAPSPEDPTVETGDWEIRCEWRNHNTGHHSEVAVIGVNNGPNSGESLTMHFAIDTSDFQLVYVKDKGGYEVYNESEGGFTITRRGHFNPGERFEFNIQIVVKGSPFNTENTGSYGNTGTWYPCKITCTECIAG